MSKPFTQILSGVCVIYALQGCTAAPHPQLVQNASADSPANAQAAREITMGMSGSNVLQILGSPNIVTADAQRHEVWVWDQVSAHVTYTRSDGTITGLTVGDSIDGGAGIRGSRASSESPNPLTIVIKFDADKRVSNIVAYRDSSF